MPFSKGGPDRVFSAENRGSAPYPPYPLGERKGTFDAESEGWRVKSAFALLLERVTEPRLTPEKGKRMKRTISVMVGKGSVRHNSRAFHAANTDPSRSHLNVTYCNEDIRQVYHELFDEAVARYNEKQTRKDRCIGDYYEKIRSGKQEKPFHEVILQIGNKDDCAAGSPDGELARKVLDEYMRAFQERNPSLRVFSAHLHMDEATPHLHIDFVPYTTGSKRGLDTRVSLKQALAVMGFTGGTRSDTEWNQWVAMEKRYLAGAMERNGIEWEQKGTHEEHLDVLDFKKQVREKEVQTLTERREALAKENDELTVTQGVLQSNVESANDELDFIHAQQVKAEKEAEVARNEAKEAWNKLSEIAPMVKDMQKWADRYTQEPEKVLPKADLLEMGGTYREKKAKPLVDRMIHLLRSVYRSFLELMRDHEKLQRMYGRVVEEVRTLKQEIAYLSRENDRLEGVERDYERVREVMGERAVDEAIRTREQRAWQKDRKKAHGKNELEL